MYHSIWKAYKRRYPRFPTVRRSFLGTTIREIRIDKGISQKSFAQQVGLNLSTLNAIENNHQKNTTAENIKRCAAKLGLSMENLIRLGRERDPANCFAILNEAPPKVEGILERVHVPIEWHKKFVLPFKHFSVSPISAPICTKKDFFVCKIELPPKQIIENLNLEVHNQVVGLISSGFNVAVGFRKHQQVLTNQQGFGLDGCLPHSIANTSEENTAEIFLATRLPNFDQVVLPKDTLTKHLDSLNISLGIHQMRRHQSKRQNRLISVRHLSELTETLDHFQIHKLMNIKDESSVISWDKIEDLLSGTGVSIDQFLRWCKNEESDQVHVSSANTRALIKYTVNGVTITSAVPPGMNCEYFLGDITVEGKRSASKSWQRRDMAMIALLVERGELEVTVGAGRSAFPIGEKESIYFDGSLGYMVRNPAEEKQAKGFIATYPAIQL